ncbi:exonuclease subunit SbcD [Neptuniibacter sp.]|uniref:exonuclease subunit SbcD n=1 Tax=Neptuniibacter sp. TaxID=1962643 RepID=UPI00261C3CAF|nr:exonuclease subunit SbcD [Neptuniibacter sp.]MCP4595806.1 exonuclease subunit SbcD [Neptuniibacter sp.]
MRILHTSDWHLGQHFISKSRANEHKQFIQWLLSQVKENQIDAVVIAGDVFDTGSPPSYARELYNQFVVEINKLDCQLIVLGGNHDSVATLNESRQLLAYLNAQVIAHVHDNPDDQIIVLNNKQGEPGAVLCAIPFLRPRDLLQSQADQSAQDKSQALGEAISQHYQSLYNLAVKKCGELGIDLPIIATGHLTAVGVKSSESVRDIYIGSLEALPVTAFPPADYIALGHIHRPQVVSSSEHIRYSGSPIPLSFDELSSQKQVVLVEFDADKNRTVTPIDVPMFQPMQVVRGDLNGIEKQLQSLPESEQPIWLSIEVEAQDYLNDLQQRIKALTEELNVEVLLLRRARTQRQKQIQREKKETLDELNPVEVFERRLAQESFDTESDEERLLRLRESFQQIMIEVQEENDLPVYSAEKLEQKESEQRLSEPDLELDLEPEQTQEFSLDFAEEIVEVVTDSVAVTTNNTTETVTESEAKPIPDPKPKAAKKKSRVDEGLQQDDLFAFPEADS